MAQSIRSTLCRIGEVPTATFFSQTPLGVGRKGNFCYAGDEQMFKEMLQLKTAAGRSEERKHAFQTKSGLEDPDGFATTNVLKQNVQYFCIASSFERDIDRENIELDVIYDFQQRDHEKWKQRYDTL